MDADIKGYCQWFAGKQNNVADALSQDRHRKDNKLTSILRFHFSKQMPKHFEIAPLPNEISAWLTSLLQGLPMREQLWELHTTIKLEPWGDGENTASPLDAVPFTWTDSENRSKFSCSGLLLWLSDLDNSQGNVMKHWLRE
jgi:hypothetical protein